MRKSGPLSAEHATPTELRRSIWGMAVMLAVLALLIAPLLDGLPLGPSPRIAILAWLLVVLAFYWLYAGMGYLPLLVFQLLLFSCAAALLTGKTALVVLDVHRLPVLRNAASVLVILGAGCVVVNLGLMIWALVRQKREQQSLPQS
jgi:hypothetical protein